MQYVQFSDLCAVEDLGIFLLTSFPKLGQKRGLKNKSRWVEKAGEHLAVVDVRSQTSQTSVKCLTDEREALTYIYSIFWLTNRQKDKIVFLKKIQIKILTFCVFPDNKKQSIFLNSAEGKEWTLLR